MRNAQLSEERAQDDGKHQEWKRLFQGNLVQHIVRSYNRIQTVITTKPVEKCRQLNFYKALAKSIRELKARSMSA